MMRFKHIPIVGRVIVVVVAGGVFAIAAVACATSFNAIYDLVASLGLYGYRMTQAFPVLVDAAFLVAEMAAILGGIMQAVTRSDEVSRGWPLTTMILCGGCTIAFNVAHAYLIGGEGDPLTVARCVVAALPPILMILSFQVLIAIVKWVMLHLGRPLRAGAAGVFDYGTPEMQLPTSVQQGNGQIGQDALSKAAAGRAYLATLDRTELDAMTDSRLAVDLAAQGVPIDKSYAGRILGQYRSNGSHR